MGGKVSLHNGGKGSFAVKEAVHNDTIACLAVLRPGMVVTGSRDETLALVNLDTGECVRKWTGHEKEVTKVVYRHLSNSHLLFSASRDATVKQWTFDSSDSKRTFQGHKFVVTGLALLSETTIATGSRDCTVRLWDVEKGNCVVQKEVPRNLVTHLSRSKAGDLLAQSGEDKELKFWSAKDLSLVHQFPKKAWILTYCSFTHDGLYCLTSSNGFNGQGAEITVYDIRQRRLLRELHGHEATAHSVLAMPKVTLAKTNKQFQQHSSSTMSTSTTVTDNYDQQRPLALSVSADHTVRVWCLQTGAQLSNEYVPSGGSLLACAAYSDGTIVASGENGCLAYLRLQERGGRPQLGPMSLQIRGGRAETKQQLTQSQSTYTF